MISIIIPAYNAQAYLRECLESVLAQSFTDWEAVIVNDGSTDSTLGIAMSYAGLDSRFKVVSTPNRGQSTARNVGLENISGDWLVYIDSDDMLHPEALGRMYDVALRTDADIVAGQYARKEKGLTVTSVSPEIISGKRAGELCLYQTGVNSSVWSKLFRRNTVEGIRFPDGIYYEDILYCIESFMQARKVAVIPDRIYYYRDTPSSFIHTFTSKRLDVLRITAMVEDMSADDAELLRAARDRRLSANFNIFGLLSVYDSQNRYCDIKRQCWQLIKAYRNGSLRNPQVRMKNKLGILISYMGQRVLTRLSGMVY